MADPRADIFSAVRQRARPGLFDDPGNVLALDNLLDAFDVPRPAPAWEVAKPACRELTVKALLEILEHEAIVREAYKDSVGVWTWGVGVTSKSGHKVDRYKDNPQSIERCIEIYVWLLRSKYLPEVLEAFGDYKLAEHELAAALSFHWNTGAIGKAGWVRSVIAGNRVRAREQFLEWRIPASIVPRRKAERSLFFDERWTHDGLVLVYPVRKPSYTPAWGDADLIDVRDQVRQALRAAA